MEEMNNMNNEVNEMTEQGVIDEGSGDLALVCLCTAAAGIAVWEGGKRVVKWIRSKIPFGKKEEASEEKSSEKEEKTE